MGTTFRALWWLSNDIPHVVDAGWSTRCQRVVHDAALGGVHRPQVGGLPTRARDVDAHALLVPGAKTQPRTLKLVHFDCCQNSMWEGITMKEA